MNHKHVFCPNLVCPARGQKDRGNIRVLDWDEERHIRHVCKKMFAATNGSKVVSLTPR